MATEALDSIKEILQAELDELVVRRDKGKQLIEHELDTARKEQLMDYWNELDNAYKRLLLAYSIITKDTHKGDNEPNCAVCLGIITEEEKREFKSG